MMAATFDVKQGLTILPGAAQSCTSAGDAGVWVAPVPEGTRAACVLRFTTTAGQVIEVRLTADDIAAIHDGTGGILAAAPNEIDHWLDQAAGRIEQLIGQSQ